MLEGLEAFRQGQYEIAARKFEESLWMSATFESGLKEYWLGRALLGMGKTREAAFALYRALRAEEGAPAADAVLLGSIRLWLGRTNDLLGKRDAALCWYHAVVDSAASASDREDAQRHLSRPFAEYPALPATPAGKLRGFLRDLAAAEDAYREEHGVYTDDPVVLGIAHQSGTQVTIYLVEGGAGYMAEARLEDGEQVCQVRGGRGTRASDRGVVLCR